MSDARPDNDENRDAPSGGDGDSLAIRRKRAAWRANHRGTKEMDWMLGRYADAQLPQMTEAELAELETLLALPDPELHTWIIDPAKAGPSELADLVDRLRTFHGLA